MKFYLKLSICVISSALMQQALASGYHFGTQSVGAQSTANAAAAEAADASTIFSNPAGLTKLEGKAEITGAANIVFPSVKYRDGHATYYRGGQVTGSDSGKITKTTAAPHIYGAYKLNNRVSVGLGMYIPYGSKTDYDDDSVLRYNLNKLGLTTVAFEPALAFKVNDKHSLAVGLVAQYSQAELTKFADWSASQQDIDLRAIEAGLAPTIPKIPGASNRANWQGRGDVKGHDWGFGYHLGWMFDVNEHVRIGAAYRSKVEHNLKGTANWQADGSVSRLLESKFRERSYLVSEGASVKITTPESLSVHGMYRATDKLNLFSDVTWTRHSRFNKAELNFEHEKTVTKGNSRTTTIVPNWRDTVKVAFGGSYQYTEPLQLRAGVAFDQSPVKGSHDRLNTLPDANRLWFSVGARYTYKQRHVLDAALSYIHINSSDFVSAPSTGENVDSKGTTSAKFKSHAAILGMQYTYKF